MRLGIDIQGKRESIPEKIKAVEDLAKDFNAEVIEKRIEFCCDNPACGFKMPIQENQIEDFNYCPRCGTKDGFF